MSGYENYTSKTVSEKITLVKARATKRYKIFTLHSGAVYKRVVEHFVDFVKLDYWTLERANSTTLDPGQFYYDAVNKTLYLRSYLDDNPADYDAVITHLFFFSNGHAILSHDLGAGEEVEWDLRVKSIGAIGQRLDEESTGTVLESTSSVGLENNDGFFIPLFDKFIWENQIIEFYSWSNELPASEARLLFKGVVDSKSYSQNEVKFTIKDFIFKLKDKLAMPLFDDSSIVPRALRNKPMRRIYGQVERIQTAPIDAVIDGYSLTGTISGSVGSKIVSGIGTSFLSELIPGSELTLVNSDQTIKLTIDSIGSNTSLTIGREPTVNFSGSSATVIPATPYRFKNRVWSVAGHKLRAPSISITEVFTRSLFTVEKIEDFFEGDVVSVNGETRTITKIFDKTIRLNQELTSEPVVSNLVLKIPVKNVRHNGRDFVIDRDYTLLNTSRCNIIFNPLAEFNATIERLLSVNLTFTNGSRVLTIFPTTTIGDFKSLLKPGDWIRKDHISDNTWHEILSVSEQTITLKTPFTGSTQNTAALYKPMDIISDDSTTLCDAMGMQWGGQWIRTASDAVKHILTSDAGFTDLDEDSFSQAKIDGPFTLSLYEPQDIGSDQPTIRDTISKINKSVFASLYGGQVGGVKYSILNSRKPEDIETLRDDDIISWSVDTGQKIINTVSVNYRPFYDDILSTKALKKILLSSEFVQYSSGINNNGDETIHLFFDNEAEIIAQRLLFYRSLSNSVVTLKGKLNLSKYELSDKVIIELDRFYNRYGGREDAGKMAIVSGSISNGQDSELTLIDLGNSLNRVPSIAPNSQAVYSLSTKQEILRNAFILDNLKLSPDVNLESEGNNLIG